MALMNITPLMSGNTTGSYVTSVDQSYSAIYYAYKAMDEDVTTYWWASSSLPHWHKFDWGVGNAKVIQSVHIQIGANATYSPNTFEIQGSNNDSDWTTLDSRTGISWVASQVKAFAFSNSTAYRYYRIYITASNSDNNITLKQIRYYEENGDGLTDITPIMTSANTPSPFVVSATSTYTGTQPWGLCDDINFTNAAGNFWTSNITVATPQEWKIDLGTAYKIKKVGIAPSLTDDYWPWDFTIEGSNDNSNWDVLHSETDYYAGWVAQDFTYFSFANTTAYRYVRIVTTKVAGVTSSGATNERVSMREVKFYADLSEGGESEEISILPFQRMLYSRRN